MWDWPRRAKKKAASGDDPNEGCYNPPMMKLMKPLLIAALVAIPSISSAEDSQLYWRRLIITSHSDQLRDEKYYLIAGNSPSAEALQQPQVCSLMGLNAGIYGASEAEIKEVLSSLKSKPVLTIVVGPLNVEVPGVPTVHIEDSKDFKDLSDRVTDAVSKLSPRLLKC